MGLFDIFKKKETPKIEPQATERIEPQATERIEPQATERIEPQDRNNISVTPDGRKVFEYYEADPEFKNGYDSTRIIVDKTPRMLGNTVLYDLLVSWYGESDYESCEPDVPTRGSSYTHVIAGIDPNLMESSPQYLEYLVKKFLVQRRVNEYKESSMMTEEELNAEFERTGNTKRVPCGRYIGEVVIKEGGKLGRRFNYTTGQAMHHTPEMEAKRAKHREELERNRQASIQRKRDQIAKLQAEIAEEEK